MEIAQRARRHTGHGLGPVHGLLHELLLRHHLVDEAHLIGPLCADAAVAHQADLQDVPGVHQAGQPGHEAGGLVPAGLGDIQFSMGRGDAEGAALRHGPAAGDGEAVDGGDGRLPAVEVVAQIEAAHAVGVRCVTALGLQLRPDLEVLAGREGPLAGAGNDGHQLLVVVGEAKPGVVPAGAHAGVHGVHALRAVHGDDGDLAIVDGFVQQFLVGPVRGRGANVAVCHEKTSLGLSPPGVRSGSWSPRLSSETAAQE
ncbi:MAG: hypothetical protein JW395_2326 [Nitrospira sp.]|nr:hypothetical protein [Nitrospira sp.]